MSYGQRKCANDELLSYFQVEAPIHRPSFFLFFSLTIKDKTKISLTIKILHLGQGSFTRKVRTIFTLKIIVSIFVKLFLIFVKRATDLQIANLECIWLVMKIKNKAYLFGTFYIPPNSNLQTWDELDQSIDLA